MNTQQALLKAAMAISEALSLLEIDPSAAKDPVALKTAYRGAARKNHPDVGGNAEIMKKVNEAYELLSEGGGSMADEPEEDDWSGAKATAILKEKLTPFKKGHAWWMPPYNLAINTALSTMNCWEFTILPMFAKKTAYRPASKDKPEGLVIDPNWTSVKNLDIGYDETGKLRSLIDKLPTIDTIEDTIKGEIASVEKHFNVTVPPEVRAYLLKEMPKFAVRRWGANRLRRKKILVPFDGSKPIELGSWD
jgi:hypothetical protein